jgi:hypothetical protein
MSAEQCGVMTLLFDAIRRVTLWALELSVIQRTDERPVREDR